MLCQAARRATVATLAASVYSAMRLDIVRAKSSRSALTVIVVHMTTGDFHTNLAKVVAVRVRLTSIITHAHADSLIGVGRMFRSVCLSVYPQ